MHRRAMLVQMPECPIWHLAEPQVRLRSLCQTEAFRSTDDCGMFYTIISINPALSGSLLAVEASQHQSWRRRQLHGKKVCARFGQLKQVIA
jgi:hypothetical protein